MNKISVFQKMEMKFTSYFVKIFSFFERYTVTVTIYYVYIQAKSTIFKDKIVVCKTFDKNIIIYQYFLTISNFRNKAE